MVVLTQLYLFYFFSGTKMFCIFDSEESWLCYLSNKNRTWTYHHSFKNYRIRARKNNSEPLCTVHWHLHSTVSAEGSGRKASLGVKQHAWLTELGKLKCNVWLEGFSHVGTKISTKVEQFCEHVSYLLKLKNFKLQSLWLELD